MHHLLLRSKPQNANGSTIINIQLVSGRRRQTPRVCCLIYSKHICPQNPIQMQMQLAIKIVPWATWQWSKIAPAVERNDIRQCRRSTQIFILIFCFATQLSRNLSIYLHNKRESPALFYINRPTTTKDEDSHACIVPPCIVIGISEPLEVDDECTLTLVWHEPSP